MKCAFYPSNCPLADRPWESDSFGEEALQKTDRLNNHNSRFSLLAVEYTRYSKILTLTKM